MTNKPFAGVLKSSQVRDYIRNLASDLEPGARIPSENELVELCRVSRGTVGRAVAELVSQGVLHRMQGKSTFVAESTGKRTVSGVGFAESSTDFQNAISALYTVAYTLKFSLKKAEPEKDFVVMPLEAQWWTESGKPINEAKRDKWCWTAMIVMPSFVTKTLVKKAVKEAAERKDLPSLGEVDLETFKEGLSAQIKHKGPYSEEGPTIQHLHEFIAEQGLKPHGKHHEVYLNDPSRTTPEKIRTIIRQPVR